MLSKPVWLYKYEIYSRNLPPLIFVLDLYSVGPRPIVVVLVPVGSHNLRIEEEGMELAAKKGGPRAVATFDFFKYLYSCSGDV